MRRVRVRVEKHHCNGLSTSEPLGQTVQLVLVEGLDHLALRSDSAADADAVVLMDQRTGAMADQGVQLRPVLSSNLYDILEAGVGDELDPSALSLQKGVGGHGRTVKEQVVAFARAQQRPESLEDGVGWIGGGGGYLE